MATRRRRRNPPPSITTKSRSEEHTSELQSQSNLVCRLLLEKKKKQKSHDLTSSQSSVCKTPRDIIISIIQTQFISSVLFAYRNTNSCRRSIPPTFTTQSAG